MSARSKKPSQPSLFGEPPKRPAGVGAAAATDEQRALAAALPRTIRLGTSSWTFPGWNGIVYDRDASMSVLARSGLTAYALHPLLRAVGVDRTFYAPLPAAALAEYASQVPEDFRFVVKAPWRCTSPRVLEDGRARERNAYYLDAGYARDESVAPFVAGLGDKGGALVFQFPPQGDAVTRAPEAFAERLGAFLSALPRGPAYTVELRDRKLFTPAYVAALSAARANHCISLHPRMPSVAEQRAALPRDDAGPLVVRWMLHSGMGYEEAKQRYEPFSRLVDEDPAGREAVAAASLEEGLLGHVVLVIVNNKAEGSSPLSVFRLAERIAAGVSGPAGRAI